MADEVEKILERLPPADGRFRRRIMAGGIVALAVSITYYSELWSATSSLKLTDVITSPSLLFGAFIIVYALGGLIEMVGQLFVIRAVGEATDFFTNVFKIEKGASKLSQAFQIVARLPIAYVGVYPALVRGAFGKTNFALKISSANLSPVARDFFQSLPTKVKDGVTLPLGDDAEFALQYLQRRLDRRGSRYISAKLLGCQETLVVLTSVLLSGAVAGPRLSESSFLSPTQSDLAFVLLTGVGVLLVLLFRGYFIMLRSTLLDLIELAATFDGLPELPAEDRSQ